MRLIVIAAMALLIPAQSAPAAGGRTVALELPHSLRAGETVFVEITTGVLKRGAEILVQTEKGELLGKISPYAVPAGRESGTYSIPVPREAVSNHRLSIKLFLSEGSSKRAPTEKEVKEIHVRVKPAEPK